jgi:hypothetical protein
MIKSSLLLAVFPSILLRVSKLVTHTHTHTHTYIYIYICIYECVYTYTYIISRMYHFNPRSFLHRPVQLA